MKRMLICAAVIVAAVPISAQAQTRVGGYVRQNGTYVAPHYRSPPNSSVYDNYSTRPNVNPYTGATGSRNPYGSSLYQPYRSRAPRSRF